MLDEILRRNPTDGDALLSRARVIGWDDRWSESHEQMVSARNTAPTHAKIKSTLDATLSYAGWHPGFPALETAQGDGLSLQTWRSVDGLGNRAYVAPGLLPAAECADMVATVEAQLQGNWTTANDKYQAALGCLEQMRTEALQAI